MKARDGSRIPLMIEEHADTDLSTNQVSLSARMQQRLGWRRVPRLDRRNWHHLALHEIVLWPCMGSVSDPRALHSISRLTACAVQELISHSHSIAEFFTADDWEYHQTSRRYFRNLINIGTSTVFRCAPCSLRAVDARCSLLPAACYAGGQAGVMVHCTG